MYHIYDISHTQIFLYPINLTAEMHIKHIYNIIHGRDQQRNTAKLKLSHSLNNTQNLKLKM